MPWVWLGVAGFGYLIVRETDETLDAGARLLLAGACAGGVYIAGKKMGAW